MKTETDYQLFDQDAIDLASFYGLQLFTHDYRSPYGIRSMQVSVEEAQEMVNEGIVGAVWTWSCEAFETCEPHEDFRAGLAGNIAEDEIRFPL